MAEQPESPTVIELTSPIPEQLGTLPDEVAESIVRALLGPLVGSIEQLGLTCIELGLGADEGEVARLGTIVSAVTLALRAPQGSDVERHAADVVRAALVGDPETAAAIRPELKAALEVDDPETAA